MSATSERASASSGCASQMRISTVGKLKVRADAPPDLRVLGDRSRLVEEADVLLPVVPALEPVGNAAAREHAREHLRARGVEIREHALDERRARRDREQLGQIVAKRAAHADRAVGAVDADVHVQPERVVAPDDVAQVLVVAAVVRRVDDALLLPRAPRVRARRRERDAERIDERAQLRAALADDAPCSRRTCRSGPCAPRLRMRSARRRDAARDRCRPPPAARPRSG